VADDVDEGGCRLVARDMNSDAELSLFDIDYYGDVSFEEKDENSEWITMSSVGGTFGNRAWHEMGIDVREGELVFGIGGAKMAYELSLSWTDREVVVQLVAPGRRVRDGSRRPLR